MSPVSKCSLRDPESSAAASAVFTLALPLSVGGKNQALLVPGLGELSAAEALGRRTPEKSCKVVIPLSCTRSGFVHCLKFPARLAF